MVKSKKLKNVGTDISTIEKYIKALQKKGLTRKQAEDHAAMYKHHFREYQ